MKKLYRIQQKEAKRKKRLTKLKGEYRRLVQNARNNKHSYIPAFYQYLADQRKSYPAFSHVLQHLSSQKNAFDSTEWIDTSSDITLAVPKVFSLVENCKESLKFIKLVFLALHSRKSVRIKIDYRHCERIEPDASAVLDVLLRDFIRNIHSCRSLGVSTTRSIEPINFGHPEILRILFSIGSYKVLNGLSIDIPGVMPFPLRVGTFANPSQREIDNTELVDYIIACLSKCNRVLTGDAESELSEIIGEVLANAEEHSSTKKRYVVGYFTYNPSDSDIVGTLNLTIFNFGDTIYQKFKDPDCPNQGVVKQMQALSEQYLTKGWFQNPFGEPGFEEETLWTLYSLQQGVTRFKEHRGSGTIKFIENFFALKGDGLPDEDSQLTLFSGNTRVMFDGTYKPETIPKLNDDGTQGKIKVMSFNRSCKINERPDRRFVNFADNFFPGTIIVAKIRIKSSNTEPK